MTESKADNSTTDFFKRLFSKLEFSWTTLLVAIFTPLVLVLAATLFGYWNTLGIDVLSYITFSSLLLDGITNVLPALLWLAFVSFFPPLAAAVLFDKTANQGKSNWLGDFFMTLFLSGVFIIGTLGYCGATLMTAIGLLIAMLIGSLLGKIIIQDHIDDLKLPLLAVAFIPAVVAYPLLAYAHGAKRAEDFLNTPLSQAMLGGDSEWGPIDVLALAPGSTRKVVRERYLPVVDVQTAEFSLEKNYFLGRIGNYYFFIDPGTLKREVIHEDGIKRFSIVNSPYRFVPLAAPAGKKKP